MKNEPRDLTATLKFYCNKDLTTARSTEADVIATKKILIYNSLFQVDSYSIDPPVLCEIFSRIGKIKVAQHNKIAEDILKMLLIEKMKG